MQTTLIWHHHDDFVKSTYGVISRARSLSYGVGYVVCARIRYDQPIYGRRQTKMPTCYLAFSLSHFYLFVCNMSPFRGIYLYHTIWYDNLPRKKI